MIFPPWFLMTNCLLHNKKNLKITECKFWIDTPYPWYFCNVPKLLMQEQVELAQCQYLLPRLSGMWTHLERQNWNAWTWGNGDWNRQTYCSRQDILIKDKIKAIDSKWARSAVIGAMVRVALVGYTNVGKSTLMNAIGKWCFCRKQTFATLTLPFEKW
jgi:hypothetical protein